MYQNMQPIVLRDATAVTPFRREESCTLTLDCGRITQMGRVESLEPPADARWFDANDCFALPGFIDIHVHGGGGYDFSDEASEAIETVGRAHAAHGTTSALATLYPQSEDAFLGAIERVRRYCETSQPDRIVEGMHLEGPFLNPQEPGVLLPKLMWPADISRFRTILRSGGPWVRVMTIAPCIPGAMDVLRAAAMADNNGARDVCAQPLRLSVGHSRATYEQISEAIDNGLVGVTHIYNGMPPMHHRDPGVLAGSLLRDELDAEVIADGIHVHPENLRLLLKMKGVERILLVTDAMRAACMPEGTYQFIGREVSVHQNQARLAGAPQRLAGSTLTMDRAVQTMVTKANVSLEQAAQMASLNPARALSWQNRRGVLAVGKDADIVVLNRRFEVQLTIKAGRIVYQSPSFAGREESTFASANRMAGVA